MCSRAGESSSPVRFSRKLCDQESGNARVRGRHVETRQHLTITPLELGVIDSSGGPQDADRMEVNGVLRPRIRKREDLGAVGFEPDSELLQEFSRQGVSRRLPVCDLPAGKLPEPCMPLPVRATGNQHTTRLSDDRGHDPNPRLARSGGP